MGTRKGMPPRGDELAKAVEERLRGQGGRRRPRHPRDRDPVVLSDEILLDQVVADPPFVPEEYR